MKSHRTVPLSIMLTAVALTAILAPSLAKVPLEAQSAFNKGILAAHEQEWDVALKSFRDALKITGSASPEIYYNLGLTESKIPGRELRAVAWLSAYLVAAPSAPNTAAVKTAILGLLVKNEGNVDRFIEVARQAAGQVPDQSCREYWLGKISEINATKDDQTKLSRQIPGTTLDDWWKELNDSYSGLDRPMFLNLSAYVTSVTTPPSPAVLAELHYSAMCWAAQNLVPTAGSLVQERLFVKGMVTLQFGPGVVH